MTYRQPRRLYVAEFKCGVIKVGVTTAQGNKRGSGLRVRGIGPVRVAYGDKHECGFWAERQLIERVRRIASQFKGREYFTGIRFGEAAHLAEQITRRAAAIDAEQKVRA